MLEEDFIRLKVNEVLNLEFNHYLLRWNIGTNGMLHFIGLKFQNFAASMYFVHKTSENDGFLQNVVLHF